MECVTAREAISAGLDSEPTGVRPSELEEHLADCRACARWRARADELARRTRVTGADPVPDLVDRVLADVSLPAPGRVPRVRRRIAELGPLPWLGALLALFAVAQIGVGLLQLLSPTTGHATHEGGASALIGHVGHEAAAFNLAVGVGILWVALHPRRARDQLPLFGTLAALLLLVCAMDLGLGEVGWVRLLTHLPIVFATLVLLALHLVRPAPIDPGADKVDAPTNAYDDHADSSEPIPSAPIGRLDPPAAGVRGKDVA